MLKVVDPTETLLNASFCVYNASLVGCLAIRLAAVEFSQIIT